MNKYTKRLASALFILGSTMVLTACGGSKSDSNAAAETPKFERAKTTVSSSYGPVGEIDTTTPEFNYVDDSLSNPVKIGYTNTNGGDWNEFSLAGGECKHPKGAGSARCTIKPDIYFEEGSEIAWWIFYEASEEEGGNRWGKSSYVFTVSGGDTNTDTVPTPTSPSGDIDNGQPTYEWETFNADSFQIGLDKQGGSGWQQFAINGKENCPPTSYNDSNCWTNSFRPRNIDLSPGDYIWWIRAKVKGQWQAWSNGVEFTVPSNGGGTTKDREAWTDFDLRGDAVLTWNETRQSDASTGNGKNFEIGYTINSKDWASVQTRGRDSFATKDGNYVYRVGAPGSKMKFNSGDQVTWWVREQVNGKWQAWSNGVEFTVPGNGGGTTKDREAWTDFDSRGDAVLTWNETRQSDASTGNGKNFEIGYTINSKDWASVQTRGRDSFATKDGNYVYRVGAPGSKMKFNSGDQVTWWVREQVNGKWQDWEPNNEGISFTAN